MLRRYWTHPPWVSYLCVTCVYPYVEFLWIYQRFWPIRNGGGHATAPRRLTREPTWRCLSTLTTIWHFPVACFCWSFFTTIAQLLALEHSFVESIILIICSFTVFERYINLCSPLSRQAPWQVWFCFEFHGKRFSWKSLLPPQCLCFAWISLDGVRHVDEISEAIF